MAAPHVPTPQYSTPPGPSGPPGPWGPGPGVPAPLGRRAGAFVIDLLLAQLVTAVVVGGWFALGIVASQNSSQLGSLMGTLLPLVVMGAVVGWYAWYCVREARRAGPGKSMTGLVVVDAATGQRLPVGKSVLRVVVRNAIGGFTFGIGWVVMLVMASQDPTGRRVMWHDQVAGSRVLDARATPATPAASARGAQPRRAPAPAFQQGPPRPQPPTPQPPPPMSPAPMPPQAARAAPMSPAPKPPQAAPPAPAQQGPATVVVQPWRLVFPDGQVVPLTSRVTLLGRDPSRPAEADPGADPDRAGDGVALVAVPDPSRQASKTHLRLEVASGVLRATDLGSTNGTQVARPGSSPMTLEQGRVLDLRDGDDLLLGGRGGVVVSLRGT